MPMVLKPKKTPSKLFFIGEYVMNAVDALELTFEMRPDFDSKGRLLALLFLHNNITYRHVFLLEEPLLENSPCGGVYNETLSLSHIAQAYFKDERRTANYAQNVLIALENGAIRYEQWASCRAYKKEASSRFVSVYFRRVVV